MRTVGGLGKGSGIGGVLGLALCQDATPAIENE
jgi:hypothetical protein